MKYDNILLIFTKCVSHCSSLDVDLNDLCNKLRILQTTLHDIPLEPIKVLDYYQRDSIAYNILFEPFIQKNTSDCSLS